MTPSLPTMASIPMAESTTNFASTKIEATAAAVQAETDASADSKSSTTLLTLASSSGAETDSEPSPTTYTTAAPVVKTTYETMYVTDIVYVTVDAQKSKRSRHYGRHRVQQS